MKRTHLLLKLLVLAALALALVFGVTTTAGAWSEGYPPEGPNGTHDWIVVSANEIAAGYQGGSSWLDVNRALAFSHYPDEVYGDTMNHIYDLWGLMKMGTAPTAVKTHFDRAVAYLKAKNVAGASTEVGLMAHYYDDIWNPWHTTYELSTLGLQAAYHIAYEDDVLGNEPAGVAADGYVRIRDASTATKTAADTSRAYFWTLANEYSSGQGYTAAVDSVTDNMLSRAANGLADLITSIKAAARYK